MEEAQKLEIRYIPLSDAVLWDENPKLHDLGALAESFKAHGFRDAPIYDSVLGGVAAGNGRVLALRWMKNEGQQPPRGVLVDDGGEWFVPIQFGVDAESQAAARAFAVDHNNLTLLGGNMGLTDVMRLWNDDFPNLVSTWFQDGARFTSLDGDDIDALVRQHQAAALPTEQPPTLENLEDEYGEHDESRMWPEIKSKVPPDVLELYKTVMGAAAGEAEWEKLQSVLQLYVDTANGPAEDQ